MLPKSLLAETTSRSNGVGPAMDINHEAGRLLVLTLGITRIIEQESLELSIWGSSDNRDWGTQPLASFPQKSYCGMYSMLLNLAARPEVKYLRAQWKMSRWTKATPSPLFGFFVDAQASDARTRSMRAAAGSAFAAPAHAFAS